MTSDWNQITEEATELLRAYVQIDTSNPPGKELAAARFLGKRLGEEGLEVIILESQAERGNLICRMRGKGQEPGLILLHHMDVVPAEADRWRYPPFSGLTVKGEIWGRGTQDCKSLGIVQLLAFLLLKREGQRPRRDIIYLATADEENGGKWGVEWLLQHHPELLKAGFLLNEGGGLGIPLESKHIYTCQTAEKGVSWFKLTFRGQPGHGSIPHEDNCIEKMARAISRISSYRSPIRKTPTTEQFIRGIAEELPFPKSWMMTGLLYRPFAEFMRRRIPDASLRRMAQAIFRNTFVPTVTQGGERTNVVPSECFCHVDGRTLPGISKEMIEDEIRGILADCRDYRLEWLQTFPASESSMDTPLYSSIGRALKKVDPKSKLIPEMLPGATDSRFFRQRGIVAYGFQPLAPGENPSEYLGRIHGHDERISKENLKFGIQVLYQILKDFCGPTSP